MDFTTPKWAVPYELIVPITGMWAMRVLHRLGELVQRQAPRGWWPGRCRRSWWSYRCFTFDVRVRWVGPFSRAYRHALFCQMPPEIDGFREYIEVGILPEWLSDALDYRPETFFLSETADSENGVGISTYHSPSFALGVSSQELRSQTNRFITGQSSVFIAHHKTDTDQTGIIYSRYVLDDHWLGSFRSTPAASND